MKNATTTTSKISAVSYITIQADLASKEGPVSDRLASLFFQLTQVREARTVEKWDSLVVKAMRAEVSVADALAFSEEGENEG